MVLIGGQSTGHPGGGIADVPADWIVSLQLQGDGPGAGAIFVHHEYGHRVPPAVPFVGLEYFRVVPYNANLAVEGLLHSHNPDRFQVAAAWMTWYLEHLYDPVVAMDPPPAATAIVELPPPPGAILDHWYLSDGSGETTCPPGIDVRLCNHRDADDSAAATFLSLAWTFVEQGGDPAVLQQPGWRDGLEAVADVILGLQDQDGLTWARSDYLVKYTMDNSEVQRGLDAMASLQQVVYHDGEAAATYGAAAAAVRAGIAAELLDPATGLFHVAKHYGGQRDPADAASWYPGTVAGAWPHLFGATDPAGALAARQMALVNTWDGTGKPDWATDTAAIEDGFLWPSIGHAALLAGDTSRALQHATYVMCERFAPAWTAGERFAYPWTVDDAGWWLKTVEKLGEENLGSCR